MAELPRTPDGWAGGLGLFCVLRDLLVVAGIFPKGARLGRRLLQQQEYPKRAGPFGRPQGKQAPPQQIDEDRWLL